MKRAPAVGRPAAGARGRSAARPCRCAARPRAGSARRRPPRTADPRAGAARAAGRHARRLGARPADRAGLVGRRCWSRPRWSRPWPTCGTRCAAARDQRRRQARQELRSASQARRQSRRDVVGQVVAANRDAPPRPQATSSRGRGGRASSPGLDDGSWQPVPGPAADVHAQAQGARAVRRPAGGRTRARRAGRAVEAPVRRAGRPSRAAAPAAAATRRRRLRPRRDPRAAHRRQRLTPHQGWSGAPLPADNLVCGSRGCGAAGSAPRSQRGGQGFESPQLHPRITLERRASLGGYSAKLTCRISVDLRAGRRGRAWPICLWSVGAQVVAPTIASLGLAVTASGRPTAASRRDVRLQFCRLIDVPGGRPKWRSTHRYVSGGPTRACRSA